MILSVKAKKKKKGEYKNNRGEDSKYSGRISAIFYMIRQ